MKNVIYFKRGLSTPFHNSLRNEFRAEWHKKCYIVIKSDRV